MNVMPDDATFSANSAFSARKPYPGWIASAPVISAAAMMRGIFRYESRLGGGPMHTSSSAKRTWSDSRSASEYTSTVWMPSSRQARMIRSAISPRLAIRILSKDSECLLECLHVRHVRGPRLGEDPFRKSGEDARWTELDECGRALPVRAP